MAALSYTIEGTGAVTLPRAPSPEAASKRTAVFRALAGNRGLRRVAGGYALFALAEYSVWTSMLVYAYSRGGALIAVPVVQIASTLVLAEIAAGTVLIRQGEEVDACYAIAAGQFDVLQDGRFIRRCERGELVGEITLPGGIAGATSVIARTDATVYKLADKSWLQETTRCRREPADPGCQRAVSSRSPLSDYAA